MRKTEFHAGSDGFHDLYLGHGIYIHWLRNALCKTVRLDLILSQPLSKPENALGALISRLGERGTINLPTMQEVGRAVDQLYGAFLSTDVNVLGNRHLLNVSLEVLSPQYVEKSDRSGLLLKALDIVRQIAMDPLRENGQFRERYVEQEKQSLREQITSIYGDKMAYALGRCADEVNGMRITPLGSEEDIKKIDAGSLPSFHLELLKESEVHFYFSGDISAEDVIFVSRRVPLWFKAVERVHLSGKSPAEDSWNSLNSGRRVYERGQTKQGKLVYGLQIPAARNLRSYVLLLFVNALLGGEGTSFLYRYLREEKKLCYFIESQVDPLLGKGYIQASVEREDYQRALEEINRGIDDLKGGRVSAQDWKRTKALLGHRLTVLREDRDALQRLSLRSLISGYSMPLGEMEYHLATIQLKEIVDVANLLTPSIIYFFYGNGVEAKES